MTRLFLPDVDFSTPPPTDNGGITPRDTLNDTQSTPSETQLTVAAENAPLRPIYGEPRLGAQIAAITTYQGDWVVLAVWGEGPCEAITKVWLDDKDLPTGATVTHYLGTTTQVADPLLVLAFAAQTPPITYTDRLLGICYSVFRFPAAALSGDPQISATVKGLKPHDPRALPRLKVDLRTSTLPDAGLNIAPSFSRSEWAYVEDYEGCLQYVPPGCPRMRGMRFVYNMVKGNTDNILPVTSIREYNNATNVDATTVNVTALPGFHIRSYLNVPGPTTTPWVARVRFEAKKISGTGDLIVDCTDQGQQSIDVQDTWTKHTLLFPVVTNPYGYHFIDFEWSSTGTYGLRNIQCEDVTMRLDNGPSEYVAAGRDKWNELVNTDEIVNYETWAFNAGWAGYQLASKQPYQVDYKGDLCASKFVENTANDYHRVETQFVPVNGVTYDMEVDIKPLGNRKWAVLQLNGAAGVTYQYVNLETGAWGAADQIIERTFTEIGNGYKRIRIRAPAGPSMSCPMIWMASGDGVVTYLGDGASGFYLGRARVKKASLDVPYLPVGNAYPYNGCFIDGAQFFDGPNLVRVRSGQNLMMYSNDMTQGTVWGLGQVTCTTDAIDGPYPGSRGCKLEFQALPNSNIQQSVIGVQNKTYYASVWLKAPAPTTVNFQVLSFPTFQFVSEEVTINVTTEWKKFVFQVNVSGVTSDTMITPYLVTRDSIARTLFVYNYQLQPDVYTAVDVVTAASPLSLENTIEE